MKSLRLRIFHKILIGYTFSVGIAVCFGAYVHHQVGQIMDRQRLVEIADDSKEQLLELRRSEKNYIIRRDPLYLDKIHTLITSFRATLKAAEPAILAAFSAGDAQRLTSSVLLYSSLVEEFAANHRETETLTTELRILGKEIEQLVLDTRDLTRIRELLEIRLLEEDYILLMEGASFRGLNERFSALRDSLAAADACGERCDLYLATLGRLYSRNQREGTLLARIREAATTMEEIVDAVRRRERENIAGYVRSSQRLLLGALFTLAVFGSLLSLFLSKMISAPLRKLEAAVRRIGEGDFDLRLEEKGDVETASLQSAFNTMLDTLHLSRQSLAHSVQLLQEKGAQLVESEKLASIGILASGVAHEINNPLTNISLTAEIVMESRNNLPDDEFQELMTDILIQTERASAVVENLLGYARSVKDSGNALLDLRDVLRRSARLVGHELKLRNIDLRQRLPAEPLTVLGNHGKLEQVFVNILLNAAHAMENGGSITLGAVSENEGMTFVVAIQDTGPGIPEENLRSLFDPFFTTKTAGKGTGLGLYISYGIIQEHGGSIAVASKVGEGTTVTVRLPAADSGMEEQT